MRRIVTHREQQEMLAPWRTFLADSLDSAATGGASDSCDPMTEECSSTNGGDKAAAPTVNADGHQGAGTKPSQGSNSEGFYDYRPPSFAGTSGSGSGGYAGAGGSSGSPASPGGGPPSKDLAEALQRAGIDPAMHSLISGFSVAEGNNPSGAPTLGFKDSQAGTTLDEHAQALARQIQNRTPVAGEFPSAGSPQEQASWMATLVGQNGVPSDWAGERQPARSDYVNRIVQNMPVAAPPTQQTAPAPAAGGQMAVTGMWRRAARSSPVVVYTKPGCVQCDMTRKRLEHHGIPHEVIDVTQDPDAYAHVTQTLGYSAAPVVDAGGDDHWSGFRPDRIKGLIDSPVSDDLPT